MQTVVGVFDTATDAELGRQRLISAGFSDDSVRVQSHSDTGNVETSDDSGQGFMSGVSHFFKELFGSDHDQTGDYSEAVRRGGTVLAVTVSDESKVEAARMALVDAGAVDIDKRAESWREQGYSSFDPSAKPYKNEEVQAERSSLNTNNINNLNNNSNSNNNSNVLPVIQEELEVGKRQVDLGAVRVFSRTESRPVTETVELREERADVARRPVDRAATEADMKAFDGGSIEVREMAERAVVNKSTRVVEEVVVEKQSDTRTETISENLRNTVVEVQKDANATANANMNAGSLNTGNVGSQQQGMSAYRTHFDKNLASSGGRYEDYEPAYAYGSTLRSDARYANRSWADVENDAQRDWTAKNPGGTWDRMKGAVRYGWDSMTGGGSNASPSRNYSAGQDKSSSQSLGL